MRATRAPHGGQSFEAIRIDADGAAVMTRAQVRALEAVTGEDDRYWAAPVSAPYRVDAYRIPGPWAPVLTVPDDGTQWAGPTYAAHAAFLQSHAAAYAQGAPGAEHYAEHYAATYGATPLEDCAPHSSEWPRWAAAHLDGAQ